MRKLTYEEVKEIFESQGNELVSTEYKGNKAPLEYICDCGKLDKKTINNFKYGQRCKECGDKKTGDGLRANKENIKELFEKENCILISEYINSQLPIEYICSCGNHAKTRVREFRSGTRCNDCNIKKRVASKQKNQNYKKQYGDLFKQSGYEQLTPYVSAKLKIKLKCPKGHIIEIKPSNFKTGYRCGDCSNNKKKTIEEVKKIFQKESYIIHSKTYIDAFTKMKVECPKGHKTEINWDNFRAGKRCGICKESKGEAKIGEYLLNNKICFEPQYRIKECKYRKQLPFDFAIFSSKDETNLKVLCEFDGKQHFEPLKIFGGEKAFKLQQKKDEIKTNYCQKNNIPLIRIPYWDFDKIEETLNRELPKYINNEVLV